MTDTVNVIVIHKKGIAYDGNPGTAFQFDISKKFLKVWESMYSIAMPDGSKWEIPVWVIALNKAVYDSGRFDNSINRALEEETLPLFSSWKGDIIDWAENNMDWDDVEYYAIEAKRADTNDFDEGWVNGKKEIIEND